jgi:hypothetical protein
MLTLDDKQKIGYHLIRFRSLTVTFKIPFHKNISRWKDEQPEPFQLATTIMT